MAVRSAEGITVPRPIPALVARDRLPAWTAQLNRLRAAAAPHAKALTVAAGPITAVGENTNAARDIVAACIAWYLGAMGDIYSRSISSQGYATEAGAILAANPRPSPRRGTVPPDAQIVLDQLAAYGTGDQVQEQLKPWDDAADIVTILLPPGMTWHNIEATLLAAAPGTAARTGPQGPASAAGQVDNETDSFACPGPGRTTVMSVAAKASPVHSTG